MHYTTAHAPHTKNHRPLVCKGFRGFRPHTFFGAVFGARCVEDLQATESGVDQTKALLAIATTAVVLFFVALHAAVTFEVFEPDDGFGEIFRLWYESNVGHGPILYAISLEIVIGEGLAVVGFVVSEQRAEHLRMDPDLPADFLEGDGVGVPNALLRHPEPGADLFEAHSRRVLGAADHERIFSAVFECDPELTPPAPRRLLEIPLGLAGAP